MTSRRRRQVYCVILPHMQSTRACVKNSVVVMSFRGGGRGSWRGRGGGRGGGRFQQQNTGPPEYVMEVGSFLHPCEEDLVCKSSIEKVPYFNAPIYLENRSQIGKVDEIFGPMNSYLFSIKLLPDMKASSFKSDQKLFIDPMKLLPLARFLPRPKGPTGKVERGGGRGWGPRGRGGRGGRGGFRGRGGRGGGFRGGGRGRGFRGGSNFRGRGRGKY